MEVPVEGKIYRTGKLNAFQQFHLARKLAPAIMALAGAASELPDEMRADKPEAFLSKAFLPIAEALANMSESDCDHILKSCLSVCERKEGENIWARVMTNGVLMYQQGDGAIDMKVMMQLTITVIKENLGGFFPVPQPEQPLSKA